MASYWAQLANGGCLSKVLQKYQTLQLGFVLSTHGLPVFSLPVYFRGGPPPSLCSLLTLLSAGRPDREVAERSRSDLTDLAQYVSSRARSQLRKQHSSTMPRLIRRLFRPTGLPATAETLALATNLEWTLFQAPCRHPRHQRLVGSTSSKHSSASPRPADTHPQTSQVSR